MSFNFHEKSICSCFIWMFQKVHMITHKYLQLVGVGAMFIASKYKEIFGPGKNICIHL
jgi:hypothetical protein